MKKYYVVSDIHGFFDEFFKALLKEGFDSDNENDILIVCGDIFDRGSQSLEVYEFLRSLPKERRILIRGNHEYLLRDLVYRQKPLFHDYINGTTETVYQLGGYSSKINFDKKHLYSKFEENQNKEYLKYEEEFEKELTNLYRQINDEVVSWILSDEWLNYYETKNYIFVHSFIPLNKYYNDSNILFKDTSITTFNQYTNAWRKASQQEWENASWSCPWKLAKEGLNKTNKTIVCGHWHTSDFFNNLKHLKKKYDVLKSNPIFKSKEYKIIGLDACTSATHKVNVLVLTEEEI